MMWKLRGMLSLLAVCVVHISTADTLSTLERVLDRIDNLEANLHHGGKSKGGKSKDHHGGRGHHGGGGHHGDGGGLFGGIFNGALGIAGGALQGAGQIAGGLAEGAGNALNGAGQIAGGLAEGTGHAVGGAVDAIFGNNYNNGGQSQSGQSTYYTGNGGSGNNQRTTNTYYTGNGGSGNNQRTTTTYYTRNGGSRSNQGQTRQYQAGSRNNGGGTTTTTTTTTTKVFELDNGSGETATITTPQDWSITRKEVSTAATNRQQNARSSSNQFSRGDNFYSADRQLDVNRQRVQQNTGYNNGDGRSGFGDVFRGTGNFLGNVAHESGNFVGNVARGAGSVLEGLGNSLFNGHRNSRFRNLETVVKELKKLQDELDE